TGLGLHIIRRYLDILNGDIEIESTLNKGTRFYLSIPDHL
ncbi:MAG: ATP-binding protein, partial [Chitinophagaceae bacterium]